MITATSLDLVSNTDGGALVSIGVRDTGRHVTLEGKDSLARARTGFQVISTLTLALPNTVQADERGAILPFFSVARGALQSWTAEAELPALEGPGAARDPQPCGLRPDHASKCRHILPGLAE